MFCKLCQDIGAENAMTLGTNNFKTSTLTRHALTTKKHLLLIDGLKTFKSIFLGGPQTPSLMAPSIYS
jgi:formate hydrogenlyase subunit 6/NADH:ubiquinone oxidoreductase subunit I